MLHNALNIWQTQMKKAFMAFMIVWLCDYAVPVSVKFEKRATVVWDISSAGICLRQNWDKRPLEKTSGIALQSNQIIETFNWKCKNFYPLTENWSSFFFKVQKYSMYTIGGSRNWRFCSATGLSLVLHTHVTTFILKRLWTLLAFIFSISSHKANFGEFESVTIWWITMKPGPGIHVPLRLNCNNLALFIKSFQFMELTCWLSKYLQVSVLFGEHPKKRWTGYTFSIEVIN